jgi:hypothetical protein
VSVPDRRAEQRHGADALQRAAHAQRLGLSGRSPAEPTYNSRFFSEQGIDISRGAAI